MTYFRIAAVAAMTACASPRAAHMTRLDAVQFLESRVPEMGAVNAALQLVHPDELGFEPPTEAELRDSETDGFWYGAAYAFAPAVRDARAAALAALALEGSAGAPGPMEIRLVDHKFGGDEKNLESVANFDLVGLLGLGPSGAAKKLARAESLLALADLAAALWQVRLDVDLARLELEVARRRVALHLNLRAEVQADIERVSILERRRRIGSSAVAMAFGQARASDAALNAAEEDVVRSLASLARATGLSPRIAEQAPSSMLIEAVTPVLGGLDPQHPQLRSARLSLAHAEAKLRAVSARAWPGIRGGPHLGFPTGGLDPLNLGGILSLSLPFPSSYEGPLEAAAIVRDRSLESYAEAVLALRIDLEEANALMMVAESRAQAAADVSRAAAAAWSAARAGFHNGRTDIGTWAGALESRRKSLNLALEASAARARAALVGRNVRGPASLQEHDSRESTNGVEEVSL